MSRLLLYYAHPSHARSRVNRALAETAAQIDGVSFVDLYRRYPDFDIEIDLEQERLRAHDVILLQFPIFWYSAPSLVKEWIDLVLEHGFAYGSGGDALAGKYLMLAVSAAGPEKAYAPGGYQRFPLRTFLTPFEQTAGLCQMLFPAPYVLFSSLRAPTIEGELARHADGYRRLIEAIRDDRFDFDAAIAAETLNSETLPLR